MGRDHGSDDKPAADRCFVCALFFADASKSEAEAMKTWELIACFFLVLLSVVVIAVLASDLLETVYYRSREVLR